ncbi:MAG: ribosome-associated translation inhibitor RaiA [Gemmatimonadetes bacterium]|nr:ribosome-associated translation inhibitor RaiA [Gemmatimonadota bacterium]
MRITITARHHEVPDALRQRAEAVVVRVARLAARPTSAQVTFDVLRRRATAELILKAARGAVHVASARASNHRSALDLAVAKLRRQLDKRAPGRRRAALGGR